MLIYMCFLIVRIRDYYRGRKQSYIFNLYVYLNLAVTNKHGATLV